VVKSRLQVVTSGGGRKYNGTWDCVVQSYRNEGIGTFYRGILPALCRAAPVNAAVSTPREVLLTSRRSLQLSLHCDISDSRMWVWGHLMGMV
jgi:hypothetical protein